MGRWIELKQIIFILDGLLFAKPKSLLFTFRRLDYDNLRAGLSVLSLSLSLSLFYLLNYSAQVPRTKMRTPDSLHRPVIQSNRLENSLKIIFFLF